MHKATIVTAPDPLDENGHRPEVIGTVSLDALAKHSMDWIRRPYTLRFETLNFEPLLAGTEDVEQQPDLGDTLRAKRVFIGDAIPARK